MTNSADRAAPLARFKDLVIDANDPARLGAFWAAVLDLTWHPQEGGDGRLTGATPEHTIWINGVPEPKTVKHRVHFDIYTTSLDALIDLGAREVERFPRWTVMADPEGGEFCAFLRDELPADRLHGLGIDCADHSAVARWWAAVYGAPVDADSNEWATVDHVPGMPILTMDFNDVPEPKTVKNRIHWDVWVDELQPLLDAGATLLRPQGDDIQWDVLADPEGNEFCAFRSRG
jgi:Glyoxalase-like domain